MRKYLLLISAMVISSTLSAQININSRGTVKIGQNTPTDTTAMLNIYKKSTHKNCSYGVKSHLNVSNIIQSNLFHHIGLLGQISRFFPPLGNGNSPFDSIYAGAMDANVFIAGVAGITEKDIAIYGAIDSVIPQHISGTYAGYFKGDVNVLGTVTATNMTTSSDMRIKTNIQNISKYPYAELLKELRPVTYNFNKENEIVTYNDTTQEMKNTHFGLIAQEVKELYPNLVYEDPNGYLSINYIEIIPLLIENINQLTDKVERLEEQNQLAQSKLAAISSNQNEFVENAVLYQNTPNPFNNSTIIEYELPNSVKTATIYIYNMTGTQIDSITLSEYGKSSITINGGALKAGIYLYSLIADGKVIDTKRMILTK